MFVRQPRATRTHGEWPRVGQVPAAGERAAYSAGYRKDVEALPPSAAGRPTRRTGGAWRPQGQRTIQVATAGLYSSRSKRASSADS
jgi:hypothetical protein